MGTGLSGLLVESSSKQPSLSVWWHLESKATEIRHGFDRRAG